LPARRVGARVRRQHLNLPHIGDKVGVPSAVRGVRMLLAARGPASDSLVIVNGPFIPHNMYCVGAPAFSIVGREWFRKASARFESKSPVQARCVTPPPWSHLSQYQRGAKGIVPALRVHRSSTAMARCDSLVYPTKECRTVGFSYPHGRLPGGFTPKVLHSHHIGVRKAYAGYCR
jgi:hypothetical protein